MPCPGECRSIPPSRRPTVRPRIAEEDAGERRYETFPERKRLSCVSLRFIREETASGRLFPFSFGRSEPYPETAVRRSVSAESGARSVRVSFGCRGGQNAASYAVAPGAGFRIRRAVVRNRRFPSWFFGNGCLVSRQLLSQRRGNCVLRFASFVSAGGEPRMSHGRNVVGGPLPTVRSDKMRGIVDPYAVAPVLSCEAGLPAAAGPVTRRGRFVRDSKRICLGGPKNLPRPAFRGSGTAVPCPVVVVRRCKKRCSVIYIR